MDTAFSSGHSSPLAWDDDCDEDNGGDGVTLLDDDDDDLLQVFFAFLIYFVINILLLPVMLSVVMIVALITFAIVSTRSMSNKYVVTRGKTQCLLARARMSADLVLFFAIVLSNTFL